MLQGGTKEFFTHADFSLAVNAADNASFSVTAILMGFLKTDKLQYFQCVERNKVMISFLGGVNCLYIGMAHFFVGGRG